MHLRSVFANEGELRTLVLEAVRSTAGLIERLQRDSEARDIDAAVWAAHELKGLARTVGAEQLGELAEQAEDLVESSRWSGLSEIIPELYAAHETFARAAEALEGR
jgi:HPt (histidine-containing phosphotransfer) domain-containing protein